MNVTSLRHYYAPIRHLVCLSVLFLCPSYRTYLATKYFFWDKQDFSSYLAIPHYHAVTLHPAEMIYCIGQISTNHTVFAKPQLARLSDFGLSRLPLCSLNYYGLVDHSTCWTCLCQ